MSYTFNRLPDQITIVHGPHEMLSRYFLLADKAARDRGIRLRLQTDFDRLAELNERHRDSWPKLVPIFDPAHSHLRIDSSFWIEGVDENDKTVVTHAARLFDWTETTLAQELAALRVFYADPAPHIAAGASIEVTAPSASRISGRTMYGGAVWVRPDYRRHGLTRIVPRISRAYACTRWDIGYFWSLLEPEIHELGVTRAYGPHRIEPGVDVRLPWRGHLPSMLAWETRDMILDDVAAIVDQATIDNSRWIEMPSTNISSSPRRQGMSSRS